MAEITREEAIEEMARCTGRFVTICHLGTNRFSAGEAIRVSRSNGKIEIDLYPIPDNKWSRPLPVEISVGVQDFRRAFTEEIFTMIQTCEMIIYLKERVNSP